MSINPTPTLSQLRGALELRKRAQKSGDCDPLRILVEAAIDAGRDTEGHYDYPLRCGIGPLALSQTTRFR